MKQLTEEQAIKFYSSKTWEDMSHFDLAKFQLHQDRLCMPFSVFHEAVEKSLNRPVYTHEFGLNRDGLIKELLGEIDQPSFEDIVNLIPSDKRLIVLS